MWLWLLIPGASAWDTVGATWPEMPVHYQIAADLGPLDDTEAVDAIHAAIATWSEVDCASVSFVEDARADSATFGAVDGHNVVFVIGSGWPEEPALLTAPAITSQGTDLAEVDVAVNAEDHLWRTDGNADGVVTFDLQAGITHEIGHLLGLWHSTVTGATMNPVMDGHPDANTLETDDLQGLCRLYPASTGSGDQGDPCQTGGDCATGLECLADGPERYCAEPCDPGVCAEGYECLDAGTQSFCARAEGCGCQTSAGGGLLPALLAALLVAFRGRIATNCRMREASPIR